MSSSFEVLYEYTGPEETDNKPQKETDGTTKQIVFIHNFSRRRRVSYKY